MEGKKFDLKKYKGLINVLLGLFSICFIFTGCKSTSAIQPIEKSGAEKQKSNFVVIDKSSDVNKESVEDMDNSNTDDEFIENTTENNYDEFTIKSDIKIDNNLKIAFIREILKDLESVYEYEAVDEYETVDLYNFIYFDNDDSYELVKIIGMDGNIYKYIDNQFVEVAWITEEVCYMERESMTHYAGGNMGSYSNNIYKYDGNELIMIGNGARWFDFSDYESMEDAGDEFYDDPKYLYSWNGVNVTEQEYYEKLNSIFDTSQQKYFTFNNLYEYSEINAPYMNASDVKECITYLTGDNEDMINDEVCVECFDKCIRFE